MARVVKFNIFEKSIFCEFSDVTHTHIAAVLKIFCSLKIIIYFAFKLFIFFLFLKCILFLLLIINFYLFFGQNTDGKELTIDFQG
jgi:hypothetical protein